MTDVAGGKVPILECVKVSWTFLLQHWQMFVPAALVVGAVEGVATAMLASSGGLSATPALGPVLLSVLPSIVAGVVFTTAVLRKAVRNEFSGPAGLGFGVDEMRLLGVLGSLILLIFPVALLFLMVLSVYIFSRLGMTEQQVEAMSNDPEALAKALIEALGPTGILAMYALFFLGVALLVYVLAKLFLVNAATIGEKKVVFFQTWSWSKGNTYRVILAMLLTSLPAAGVNFVLQSLAASVAGAGAVAVIAVSAATAFIAALLSIPQIALGAHLYKGLRPPGFVAK